MKNAKYWVENLDLISHPEGGWFRETYRSAETVERSALDPRYNGPRRFCTGIYFLLEGRDFSAFHRLKSDEIWCFHDGCPLKVWVISPGGELAEYLMGTDTCSEQAPQLVIRAGSWFAATPEDPHSFTLFGCFVTPGFEFDDFELAHSDALSARYPQHAHLIRMYTRLT
jgi:hypothetical protein